MATKRQFCALLYSIIVVLIVVLTFNFLISKFTINNLGNMSGKFVSVDFEVFGRVQGVFFRKYTKMKSKELNLVGWCMNTHNDSVVGHIEGDPDGVSQMKIWLQKQGSPSSEIEEASFKNEKQIEHLTFTDFEIRK